VKHLCVSDKRKRILYASRHYPGKTHDKTMLLEESSSKKMLQRVKKLFDLAFLGIDSEYKNVVLPNKKPKGKELTKSQKESNKRLSKKRVKIENAFAGVKRMRIVYNVSRTRKTELIDQTFLITCGIWNFYLSNKK
jgi:hypothetical protein